jgi:hypothetical protein
MKTLPFTALTTTLCGVCVGESVEVGVGDGVAVRGAVTTEDNDDSLLTGIAVDGTGPALILHPLRITAIPTKLIINRIDVTGFIGESSQSTKESANSR